MNCPHCMQKLNREFHHRKIVFRCSVCGGQYVTIAALRGLCGSKNFTNRIWRDANVSQEAGVICPSCGKPAKKITPQTEDISGIELDVCTGCQSVWFDPFELETLPPVVEKAEEKLPPKAAETAALEKVKRMVPAPETGPSDTWKYLPGLFGMPVEACQQRRDRIPFITWGIAALCTVLFLISVPHLKEVIANYGFIPAQWNRLGGFTLLSSMFLHSSIMHLVSNMYFLLVFGDDVENEFGYLKYAALILFSELCGTLCHILLDNRPDIPCVGASGFISGIIICYAVCFPKADISFFCFRFFHCGHWITVPAWLAALLWIAGQFAMVIARSPENKVAVFSHLGGAAAGAACGIIHRIISRKRTENQINQITDFYNFHKRRQHENRPFQT